MNQIKDYYEEYNYPSADKLYKIMKKEGINVDKSKVKEFVDKQIEKQLTTIPKIKKKEFGKIVAFVPFQKFQIDIFDLSKYSSYNKNYKYIFVMIDIFSRFVFAVPLKNKDIDSTTNALKKLIDDYDLQPYIITSDSDSSFLGKKFQALLDKHGIYHNTVIINDHKALSVIDRFARTIKTIISKFFIRNQNKNWIDYISKIINQYNNTPHSSIDNIKPNEATEGNNRDIIYNLNVDKSKLNDKTTKLQIGDLVRVKITGEFKKGTEPNYSDETYTVKSISGKTAILDNDEKFKLDDLLVIPKDTEKVFKNVIKEVNKKSKVQRQLDKEGIKDYLGAPKTSKIQKRLEKEGINDYLKAGKYYK